MVENSWNAGKAEFRERPWAKALSVALSLLLAFTMCDLSGVGEAMRAYANPSDGAASIGQTDGTSGSGSDSSDSGSTGSDASDSSTGGGVFTE